MFLRDKNQIGNAVIEGRQSAIVDELTVEFLSKNIENPSFLNGWNKEFHSFSYFKKMHF